MCKLVFDRMAICKTIYIASPVWHLRSPPQSIDDSLFPWFAVFVAPWCTSCPAMTQTMQCCAGFFCFSEQDSFYPYPIHTISGGMTHVHFILYAMLMKHVHDKTACFGAIIIADITAVDLFILLQISFGSDNLKCKNTYFWLSDLVEVNTMWL